MPILDNANKTASLVIKLLIIAAACVGIAWLLLSVVGNVVANNPDDPYSKAPAEKKAGHEFYIKATRQKVYAVDYETVKADDPQQWLLQGYWTDEKGKYRHNEGTLLLDEYYWGEITVTRRAEQ